MPFHLLARRVVQHCLPQARELTAPAAGRQASIRGLPRPDHWEAVQEDHPMHGWDKCTWPLTLPGPSKTIASLVDAMRVASQAADPAYHVDPLPHSSTKLSHASGGCSNMAMLVKMPTPHANEEAVE